MAIEITDWDELDAMRDDLTEDYVLMNDLDSGTSGYSTVAGPSANSGAGWLPVGDVSTSFTGTFDGGGYTISDLYIDRTTQYNGLFGRTGGGGGGTISYVGIVDCDITSTNNYTGALIGAAWSITVTECYSTGTINGAHLTGGLLGYAPFNSTTNCYSKVNVTTDNSNRSRGGCIGGIYEANIYYCYSTGAVLPTGGSNGGGFCGGILGGTNNYAYNYWDKDTSGWTTSQIATGKTTTEMYDIDTFDPEWDIVDKILM